MSNNDNERIQINIHEIEFDDQINNSVLREEDYQINNLIIRQPIFYINRRISLLDEINRLSAINRVRTIMVNLFGDMIDEYSTSSIMEDRIMRAAMSESLSHYNTQERKPNIELKLESQQVSDKYINEICAICKEKFELGEKITSLLCNHTLHTDCISEWIKYKSECPVCRSQIETLDLSENKDL